MQNSIKANLKNISMNFEEKENEINENEYENIISFDNNPKGKSNTNMVFSEGKKRRNKFEFVFEKGGKW